MADRILDVLGLEKSLRELVGECELTGQRTIFTRNEKKVVALVSYDEYLALRETIEIAADASTMARLRAAEEDVTRNRILAMEDLLVE